MRILIDMPNDQVSALTEICKEEKLTRAAIIRQAIAVYLAQRRRGVPEATFGLWRDKSIDGLEYQKNGRAEW